jgi:hypothetical protein
MNFLATLLEVDPNATVQVGVLMQGVLTVLTAIVIGLLTWALKRLIAIDRTMTQLQQWHLSHEKQDDERHEENLGKFDAIFNALSRKRG